MMEIGCQSEAKDFITRARIACRRCHTLKKKCIRTDEGACERCKRAGHNLASSCQDYVPSNSRNRALTLQEPHQTIIEMTTFDADILGKWIKDFSQTQLSSGKPTQIRVTLSLQRVELLPPASEATPQLLPAQLYLSNSPTLNNDGRHLNPPVEGSFNSRCQETFKMTPHDHSTSFNVHEPIHFLPLENEIMDELSFCPNIVRMLGDIWPRLPTNATPDEFADSLELVKPVSETFFDTQHFQSLPQSRNHQDVNSVDPVSELAADHWNIALPGEAASVAMLSGSRGSLQDPENEGAHEINGTDHGFPASGLPLNNADFGTYDPFDDLFSMSSTVYKENL
jgi:hypothetical protein